MKGTGSKARTDAIWTDDSPETKLRKKLHNKTYKTDAVRIELLTYTDGRAILPDFAHPVRSEADAPQIPDIARPPLLARKGNPNFSDACLSVAKRFTAAVALQYSDYAFYVGKHHTQTFR